MTRKWIPDAPDGRAGKRRRLDELVLARGLADSRSQAQALIRAGKVFSSSTRLDKPGRLLPEDVPLALRGPPHPWVSRGGVKLAFALDRFGIAPEGVVALDVGASTGGFTDVLLARGAARVYAVDVGRGQLAWRLRTDPRVAVLERLNARHLDARHVPEPPQIVTCDVSFIGLERALPPALALAAPGARLVALVKPQFEAGRREVGKGGIVRSQAAREAACRRVSDWLDRQPGWRAAGLVESPIAGAGGNREYLLAGRKEAS